MTEINLLLAYKALLLSIKIPFGTKNIFQRKNLTLASTQTTFSAPEIVAMGKLQPVDPMVLNLFPNSELRNFTLTGRLKHLLKYWEVLPSNPEIPEWVSALNTNFNLGQAQKKLAQQEKKCQFQNPIWQVGK